MKIKSLTTSFALICSTLVLMIPSRQAAASYLIHNLVSDGAVTADHTDENLVNPWGLAINPTGFFWVADNGTGKATLYDGNGVPASLIVDIPPVGEGNPSGQVFHGGTGFVVSEDGKSGPSRFMFSSEDGTISGWSPGVNLHTAVQLVDRSSFGAHYKGLAIGSFRGQDYLYATNFGQNQVDMFDSNMNLVKTLVDPRIPSGYSPFGIQVFGDYVYITYALKGDNGDDVAGAGHGFIDIFKTNGHFLHRLVNHSVLNSPWGLAIAPRHWGRFSHALLVGNFGDGRINAFNPISGHFLGSLKDANHQPLVINGLWGLAFGLGFVNGNGVPVNGGTQELFFTAGINDEADGLFGKVTYTPQPGDSRD